MNHLTKLLLVCAPFAGLAACGGSDTADRLDVADPVVRFVHASPIAPNLTLYRGTVAQSDATNVPYKFASNYFDVDMGISPWPVKTADGVSTVGTVSIDPVRGTKYTVVALSTSVTASDTYLIVDPYNRSLNGDTAYVRLMNASFNAANVDLYMTMVGTNIAAAGVNPLVTATAYKTAGPASGGDSAPIQGATYQVTVTSAGTKTILFNGQLSIGNSKDVLLLTVPDTGGAIKVLVKTEGAAGATELVPS
ncbi:MAG: DUF4397 domain-containing protein [Burkholderiales bacterium]